MALRALDIYLPTGRAREHLGDLFDEQEHYVLDLSGDEGCLVRIVLEAEKTEALVDTLSERIGSEDYRVVLVPVEASLPRAEEDEEEQPDDEDEKDEEATPGRVSREEVYQDLNDDLTVATLHYTLIVLSAVVAMGGMLRDSTAVVIGAMVIAPLLGPNIALALGTTLGDMKLIGRALRVNLAGLLLAVGLSMVGGVLLTVDASIPEVASRTDVTLGDLALALAAGVAGTLSTTRGVSTALVGVMVAVALMPPAVAVGLLVGAGDYTLAMGAGLLLVTNVVAINLAAVATFIVQGIRPTTWYEAERARKATRLAIAFWTVTLLLLVAAIVLSDGAALW
ncbi:MAG: TIGR00341 family protein [Bacteroidetes bacterium]|jgi:uncharacterized hydrophobic protein (TIGR00341 family)|nr:TIGR00341 family protein [Bacteroidota bacterium]